MNILTGFGLDTATIVALVVSVVIPALSSALAKSTWSAGIVGLLTLALSTGNGFFAEWAKDGNHFNWKVALGTAVVSYAIAVLARYGLLKGTTTDAKLRKAIW